MTSEGYIDVPGARLFYRAVGHGPVLLLLPGGDGDADTCAALASHLGEQTVVSYDRRGLSRSVPHDPDATPGIGTHAADAAAVLATVTDVPADVFGSSIGAVIGLELLCRTAERVRRLVAHEPPLTQFLPDADRPKAVAAQLAVEQAFADGGLPSVFPALAALAGFDPTDREPDAEVPRPDATRTRNMAFFIRNDAPSVRTHVADLEDLRGHASHLVLGAGPGFGGAVQPGLVARRLAALLPCTLAEFPGGHNAPVFRPAAVAARLREVLDA